MNVEWILKTKFMFILKKGMRVIFLNGLLVASKTHGGRRREMDARTAQTAFK